MKTSRTHEIQHQPEYRLTARGRAVKKAGEVAVFVTASVGVAAGLQHIAASQEPTFHGEKTVLIDGSIHNVTDLAREVEGSENGYVNETVDRIVKQNPSVFQDRGENKSRAFIESEDVGEEVTIPESVN